MPETTNSSNGSIIEVRGVTRTFGPKTALNQATLTVPRGGVFGLIGGNGAGKTTLIKHILGLYKPQVGTVAVFGLDPVADPVGTLGRIGYLSEERDLPDWMSIAELMNYTKAFFPRWDSRFAEELRESFEISSDSRVKTLSRGQRARAGLLIALAHRPDLLVLDEPSSGLDPVVRRDILGAIIRTIADEGRTVLFSSHLLDEVERVADRVAIIHEGQILQSSSVEEMQNSHRRFTIRFAQSVSSPPALPGAITGDGRDTTWSFVTHGDAALVRQSAQNVGAVVVEDVALSLDEIFVSLIQKPLS